MAEVLFLAHRIPFPADRGDKIRSHHVLRAIARLAPVHVACFADDDHDLAEEFELAGIAASHCLVERTKPVVQAGLEALARGVPVSLAAFRHAQSRRCWPPGRSPRSTSFPARWGNMSRRTLPGGW